MIVCVNRNFVFELIDKHESETEGRMSEAMSRRPSRGGWHAKSAGLYPSLNMPLTLGKDRTFFDVVQLISTTHANSRRSWSVCACVRAGVTAFFAISKQPAS